ncbi:protein FAR-RED ELONGATED HYPOCOTYL 3-like [Benincasa hispida]|uniref:protein FAR-RED ELONGATED HYPOCOTYL 3-like n=1 Tax=Benincasa hispida TaxID=102211 RepID=UPI0018FF42DD|nr:protein FAR-RED ELONGATED HYPOCOTYL 3-like [Benincasa hispida]
MCIRGFLNCICLVIVVDETHLHEKYKGMLLIATYINGNINIYPIAFSIVDGENDASWTWFMTHLTALIGDVPNLVIISDRHISIAKAVASIFPDAFHALCIYHIWNNLVDKFKNRNIIPHFYLVAKAYRMFEFQMYWAKLHQYPGVMAYLEEVGLQLWARVYQVYCKYDKMTTNIVEYLNRMLKDARELPIIKLLKHIHEWL